MLEVPTYNLQDTTGNKIRTTKKNWDTSANYWSIEFVAFSILQNHCHLREENFLKGCFRKFFLQKCNKCSCSVVCKFILKKCSTKLLVIECRSDHLFVNYFYNSQLLQWTPKCHVNSREYTTSIGVS